MLNLKADKSYYQWDGFGLLWVPSDKSWESRSLWKRLWDLILKRDWILTWTNKSRRDTIGRTVLAGLAYGFIPKMIEGLEACYHNGILYRHPGLFKVASRDHHSYFYIYRKYTGQELPDFPRMRGMTLWMKSLAGKSGFLGVKAVSWYYFWNIPLARFGNWWLRVCRWTGRISEESTNEWWIKYVDYKPFFNGLFLQQNRTPWQNIWGKIILNTIPAFALHIKAWQIYILQKTPKRDALCKILLSRIGISNIMMRLLLGDTTVSEKDVSEYPAMTGYRPGVYLDESCRRDIREMTLTESEFNSYEKDLIQWLYENKRTR